MATAAAVISMTAAARGRSGPSVTLYAEALALTTDGFAEIAELRLHDIGHGFARGIERVAELFADGVDGHAIPDLPAALGRPPRTGPPAFARPAGRRHGAASGSSRQRRDRPSAGRAPAQHQRRTRADHCAEDGGGQQVVLLVTLARSSAVGRAVARAIHSRSHRSRHGSP